MAASVITAGGTLQVPNGVMVNMGVS
jgi:hypothetical protein